MGNASEILNLVGASKASAPGAKPTPPDTRRSGPEGFFRSLQASLGRNQNSAKQAQKLADKPADKVGHETPDARNSTAQRRSENVALESKRTQKSDADSIQAKKSKVSSHETSETRNEPNHARKVSVEGDSEKRMVSEKELAGRSEHSEKLDKNGNDEAGENPDIDQDAAQAEYAAPSAYQEIENLLRQLGLDFTQEEIRSPGFLRNLEAMLSQPGGLDRLRVIVAELRSEMPPMVSVSQNPGEADKKPSGQIPVIQTGKEASPTLPTAVTDSEVAQKTPVAAGETAPAAKPLDKEVEAALLGKIQALLEKMGKATQPTQPVVKTDAPVANPEVNTGIGHGVKAEVISGMQAGTFPSTPAVSNAAMAATVADGISEGNISVTVVKNVSEPATQQTVPQAAVQTIVQATAQTGAVAAEPIVRAEERVQRPTEGLPSESALRTEAELARRMLGGFDGNAGNREGNREGYRQPTFNEATAKNADINLSQGLNTASSLERPGVTPLPPANLFTSVPYKEVLQQITGKLQALTLQGKESISIQLRPEHLGRVAINLDLAHGIMKASIMVENEQVKQMLESNLAQLRETLELQGVRVTQMDISVQNPHRNLFNPEGQNAQSFFTRQQQRERDKNSEKEGSETRSRPGEDTGQRWGYNTLEIVA